MEGTWPDVMLIRKYRCKSCGYTFKTAEVSLDLTPLSWSGEH